MQHDRNISSGPVVGSGTTPANLLWTFAVWCPFPSTFSILLLINIILLFFNFCSNSLASPTSFPWHFILFWSVVNGSRSAAALHISCSALWQTNTIRFRLDTAGRTQACQAIAEHWAGVLLMYHELNVCINWEEVLQYLCLGESLSYCAKPGNKRVCIKRERAVGSHNGPWVPAGWRWYIIIRPPLLLKPELSLYFLEIICHQVPSVVYAWGPRMLNQGWKSTCVCLTVGTHTHTQRQEELCYSWAQFTAHVIKSWKGNFSNIQILTHTLGSCKTQFIVKQANSKRMSCRIHIYVNTLLGEFTESYEK